MIKKNILFFFISLLISSGSYAYYELDQKLDRAYVSILSLRFDEAEKLLNEEAIEKPNNGLVLLYRNYIDFLKAFITEDEKVFEALKSNSESRINLLTDREENQQSPFHLYAQAEILIQQALVRIKFEENIISAGEIRRAYKLIEKNEKLFPSFPLNKMVNGFLHSIVGSVPPKFQWVVKLAGMKGTLSQGLAELRSAYESVQNSGYESYKTEILFYLGNIYSVFSMAPDDFPVVEMMKPYLSRSPLITYVYVNILMKTGKNEDALVALNTTLSSKQIFPFYFLYYKRGLARLRKLDTGSADDFKFYLNHYTGSNNIKAAYQKLAWISLLSGDSVKYKSAISNCKNKGALLIDEDRDANFESLSFDLPNLFLLKARLLFDGGYYSEAMAQISGKSISNFPKYRDQLEVTYRMGRIMQMSGNIEKAIVYYEQTLKNGASSRYYFSANSSLLLGNIYEARKDNVLARMYYKKCLTLDYDQYKNSIDQKAQAGIERLSVK